MDTAIRMIPMPVRNRPRLPGLHVQKKAPPRGNEQNRARGDHAIFARLCGAHFQTFPPPVCGPGGTRPGAPGLQLCRAAGPAGVPSRRRGGVTASALTRASPRQMASPASAPPGSRWPTATLRADDGDVTSPLVTRLVSRNNPCLVGYEKISMKTFLSFYY